MPRVRIHSGVCAEVPKTTWAQVGQFAGDTPRAELSEI